MTLERCVMGAGRRATVLVAGALLGVACARGRAVVPDFPEAIQPVPGAAAAPAFLLGTFRDDYGGATPSRATGSRTASGMGIASSSGTLPSSS